MPNNRLGEVLSIGLNALQRTQPIVNEAKGVVPVGTKPIVMSISGIATLADKGKRKYDACKEKVKQLLEELRALKNVYYDKEEQELDMTGEMNDFLKKAEELLEDSKGATSSRDQKFVNMDELLRDIRERKKEEEEDQKKHKAKLEDLEDMMEGMLKQLGAIKIDE